MIYPKLWLKYLKVRRAVVDYPLYDIPHKQAERTLTEAQVQENYSYFMSVRLDRLAYFQNWLLRNFRVKATLDGDGLLALNAWINTYGGGLIGDETYTAIIFDSYNPRWQGEYAGYNVMVDISIFIGEYLISKRPRLHWDFKIDIHHEANREAHIKNAADQDWPPYYGTPVIVGFPRGGCLFVFAYGYGGFADSRKCAKIGHNPVLDQHDNLITNCKSFLYQANIPDGDGPFIIGDYSNERL